MLHIASLIVTKLLFRWQFFEADVTIITTSAVIQLLGLTERCAGSKNR
jgi:hypothetical protein